jgi:hypothetical protein
MPHVVLNVVLFGIYALHVVFLVDCVPFAI